MSVTEVTPSIVSRTYLAGAQFADAYCIEIEGAALDAGAAAPLGLKTSGEPTAKGIIGLFPVVSTTSQRLVAGFDDHHLDFRIIVDVAPASNTRQQVTSTTLVRTHNRLGLVYLRIVMPFHRVIARAMLRQVASHG
jgi:Protein of unknown function (DUF2867)